MKDIIEIPFGAHDSELKGFVYTIPEGFEAEIKDGKVIVRQKESEDEKIRQAVVELVKWVKAQQVHTDHFDDSIKWDEMIAYLEKQKDLTKEGIIKQLEEEFYACGTTPKWFHDTVQGAINHGRAEALGEIKAHEPVSTIEQKEQKPTDDKAFEKWLDDWYQGSKEAGGDIVMSEAEFKNWSRGIRNMYQQKPAEWSEFDKGVLNDAICAADMLGNDESFNKDNPNLAKAFRIAKDWLKFFPERFNLQPKTEWSEEDEETLACAISVFEDFAECKNVSVPPASAKRYLKRLKSLRPYPKQEWSEEDEANFTWFDKFFRAESIVANGRDIPQDKYLWFKSLRQQPQGTYKQVIRTIFGMLKDKDFYKIQPSHRVSLLNDIRVKCKDAIECAPILDEPHWKPSEEQIKALERAIVKMHTPNDIGILAELRDNLKKL